MSEPALHSIRRDRRFRLSPASRALVEEATLDGARLVQPLFVVEGETGLRAAAPGLPGIIRLSTDRVEEEADELRRLGLSALLLFGVVPASRKTPDGQAAADPDGPVPTALRILQRALPGAVLFADTCLCEYTSHGHCGLIDPRTQAIDNDASIERLAETARVQAQAGAHFVAPSDMLDGRIAHIRRHLDQAGFAQTGILSYAAKFASALYGPFRHAAESCPAHGDRRTHQFPPANRREAIREALQDEAEGADALMVKPATPYLDILHELRLQTRLPLAAYQVSGEYAMIHAAAAAGHLDLQTAAKEHLLAIRRAGADFIVTYFAKEWHRWRKRNVENDQDVLDD